MTTREIIEACPGDWAWSPADQDWRMSIHPVGTACIWYAEASDGERLYFGGLLSTLLTPVCGDSAAEAARRLRPYVDVLRQTAEQLWSLEMGERPPKAWKCSGCGHVMRGPVGRCKGYCYDASGESCDAVPCPECGRYHHWTGSMTDAERNQANTNNQQGAA